MPGRIQQMMRNNRLRRSIGLAFFVGGTVSLFLSVTPVHGQGEAIQVKSSSITSEFPDGFRVKLEATGENEITSIAVRLKIGQQTRGAYDYLCQGGPHREPAVWRCADLEPGKDANAEIFWRTGTAGQYIPPGTLIKYNFEIEDSEGGRLDTEQQEFIYHDPRFEWSEVSDGTVSVAYHGPVKTRAENILEAIQQTMDTMGPLLGAGTEETIRVTIYNNPKEMLDALPPRSVTIGRELFTEGQAFTEVGTLLVYGGGRMSLGTSSHEVTHILVHRVGDGIFRRVPAWLNEGLAEYGNIDPGFSYDIALEFAVATGRLLPVVYLEVLPGDPEEVIIFYGESRSIVRLMISQFGGDKMAELMATLKNGKKLDDALQEVYGFDRQGLDNMWRDSINAARYVPPATGAARPTPLPRRAILPYSLTPQPETETIGSQSAEPTPTATPEPTATATPVPLAAAVPAESEAAPDTPTETQEPAPASSSCNRPASAAGPLDLTTAGLLFGLAGLGLRRRNNKN